MARIANIPENQTASRLRLRLVDRYDAKFMGNERSAYFFELPYIADKERQIDAFCAESLYSALVAGEIVIAFRAYCQAVGYSNEIKSLKYHYESAFYEAKRRIEDVLGAFDDEKRKENK